MITNNLSVRETEALVRKLKTPIEKKTSKKYKRLPPYINSAKKDLSTLLDSKISIKTDTNGKGKLTIPFKNKKDFQRILNLLKSDT